MSVRNFISFSLLIWFIFAAEGKMPAQVPLRVIESVKVTEQGSDVVFTLTEAYLQQYITRESAGEMQLVLPNAGSSVSAGLLYNGNTGLIRAEQKGPDAVFTFLPKYGYKTSIRRYQNQLMVVVGHDPAPEGVSYRSGPAIEPVGRDPERNIAAGSAEIDFGKLEKRLSISRVRRRPGLTDLMRSPAAVFGREFTDFRQYRPKDGSPVSRPTRAFLGYDDINLYVGFICSEEKGKVRAHMAKRENIGSDDSVSVILDTYRDQRRAYIFTANPLGVQWDAITTDGRGSDSSFDAVWYTEGRVTEDGYVLLMEIPFKSLRFANNTDQIWGVALKRKIAGSGEESYYPYITQREEGFVRQAAAMDGIEDISPSRNIQVTPYYVAGVERTPDNTADPTRPFQTTADLRAGVDAKIVLRNTATLDLTVNPDFSQVESDEPQVTINKRYETYFPEKRPFFIENAGFFATPENLFFSRRIVDPQFGARITGKAGQWAYGGLLMDDRSASATPFRGQFRAERRAAIGVARLQREFGEQSSVGMFVSNYDLPSRKNRVISFDSRLRLNDNWSITAQFSRSYVQRANDRLEGNSYLANISRRGRRFTYDLDYLERSSNYYVDLGFIPRRDIRQVRQNASYTWRPNKNGVVSVGTNGYVSGTWDTRNRLQDWYVSGDLNFYFTGLTGFSINRAQAFELFDGREFDTEMTSVSAYSDRLDWLGLYGSYYWGTAINYSPAGGLPPFRARASGGSAVLSLRPNTQLSFQQTYIFSHLASERPFSTSRENIYYNHVFRSKLNYQISKELSLRLIVDYNAVLPNSYLVQLGRYKAFTTDILLTYLISPGTGVYLGYTDGYESYDDPWAPVRLGPPAFDSSGRRVFIKVTNLFRF